MVLRYTKKEITKMFVFVIIKEGEKKKLHILAKDIETAFQNAENTGGAIDGEVLEIFSFDRPVNMNLYAKVFNFPSHRAPVLPVGIPGLTYREWVPEKVIPGDLL
jgi:hypothetical protein